MDFLIGGLSAGLAGIFSNPFDVVKTRMQLQGELAARGQHAVHYKNVFHAGWMIVKHEGITGIQKGLSTAVVMHFVRNFARLGMYQWWYKNGYLTDANGKTIFYRSALASAVSGATGALLGSPLFLIKTQLQSNSADQIAVGTQHKHTGAIGAFKTVYTKHGIIGLYRGVDAVVVRAIVGSSAQLSSFALMKDLLKQVEYFENHRVAASFAASVVGGMFQTLIMTPFDLVATRLYNQAVDKDGKGVLYSGITDCFMKIGRTEGFRGYYKGVTANYMRLAPHGALCLVFWDAMKYLQTKYS